MALAAVEEALAEHAARADRDFRLADMIARTQWIAFRIEEGQHSPALIIMHHGVDDRHCSRERDARTDKIPDWKTGEKHHRDPAEHHHQAGAHVGLDQDQPGGDAKQEQRRPHRAPLADFTRGQKLVKAGKGENDCRLHEFGRLEADRAELEPALGALLDQAERLDPEQHQHDDRVAGEGQRLQRRFLDRRNDDCDGEEEQEHHRLLVGPRRKFTARRRVKRDQPETRDSANHEDQPPRQAREWGGQDGRADHALELAAAAASTAAARRALRSVRVPPHPASSSARRAIALDLSNK